MLTREYLLNVISGKRRGVLAVALRGVLYLLSFGYRWGIGSRNRKFDSGVEVNSVEVPVVSIGNLTTGGTGKSPLVIWISRFLRAQNIRVAVLSRGYKAKENQTADEAIEFQQRLNDVPHLQSPDRHQSARTAIDELEMQVLVLDDGFQHRKLNRDLDIVLIDATLPFGFGFLLPRGLLREPKSSLARADFVLITRCDQVSQLHLDELRSEIARFSQAPVATVRTNVSHLLRADGQVADLDSLRGQNVYGFCGIGNPENFWKTVETQGMTLAGKRAFADHHDFQRADIEKIAEEACRCGAKKIVCTHKDLVKLGLNQINEIPVYSLVIDLEFESGQEEFEAALVSAISPIDTGKLENEN